MSAWSELPNAAHIDRVIASVKAHPKIWGAAGYAAWYAAGYAAWYAAGYAAWNAAWKVAWNAAWKAARDAARDAARVTAGYAALALIAYDDCAHYLNMSPDRLRAWATLSESPAAVLLLPAVIAFEQINELEVVVFGVK